MNLCLSMIVRNESARIERALASVAPYITSWVIIDTGSTDDTKQKIVDYFTAAGIMGEVRDAPFVDFSQARNAALDIARSLTFAYQPEFFLLMDADMELVVKDAKAFLDYEGGISYEMTQRAGAVSYTNSRLLNVAAGGHYKGVTHEYLDVPTTGRLPESVAYFVDHADGTNRKDKFKRDIRLLKQGLKDEPSNARYMFYLASSYRDAGKFAEAAKWFQRRVRAGGWDEEVWQAQLGYAHALKDLGDHDGFISHLLTAYHMRPTRAETMYDLAKWQREHNQPAPALAAAEAVEHLTRPDDSLFVNDFVYTAGIQSEIAISAFYVPGKRDKGRRANDKLSMLNIGPHWEPVNLARHNQFFYVQPLVDLCPSFQWKKIPFDPPDALVPMNPSVVVHDHNIHVLVRCVNYRIDAAGRYIITSTDGTANAENPIDTRNFILALGTDPMRAFPLWSCECYRPGNMDMKFPLVTGFEDMRLISRKDGLWASATVRQLEADGQCEQVLTHLEHVGGTFQQENMRRMLRSPRVTEKNWSPIQWDTPREPLFMWRPGTVLNALGHRVIEHTPPVLVDNLSGSSQTIPYEDGWLSVLHTAHGLPNEPHKRYYYHRFIEYTGDFRVRCLSLPFYFNEPVIEFCAGLCWNSTNDTFVLSYGYKDSEARIATVHGGDVRRLLDGGHSYA